MISVKRQCVAPQSAQKPARDSASGQLARHRRSKSAGSLSKRPPALCEPSGGSQQDLIHHHSGLDLLTRHSLTTDSGDYCDSLSTRTASTHWFQGHRRYGSASTGYHSGWVGDSFSELCSRRPSRDDTCSELNSLKNTREQSCSEISSLKHTRDQSCSELNSHKHSRNDSFCELSSYRHSRKESFIELNSLRHCRDEAGSVISPKLSKKEDNDLLLDCLQDLHTPEQRTTDRSRRRRRRRPRQRLEYGSTCVGPTDSLPSMPDPLWDDRRRRRNKLCSALLEENTISGIELRQQHPSVPAPRLSSQPSLTPRSLSLVSSCTAGERSRRKTSYSPVPPSQNDIQSSPPPSPFSSKSRLSSASPDPKSLFLPPTSVSNRHSGSCQSGNLQGPPISQHSQESVCSQRIACQHARCHHHHHHQPDPRSSDTYPVPSPTHNHPLPHPDVILILQQHRTKSSSPRSQRHISTSSSPELQQRCRGKAEKRSSSVPSSHSRFKARYSTARDSDPAMKNLSLCGCGFLGMYHLGAAACLVKHGPSFLAAMQRVAGASAGALVAALLVACPTLKQIETSTELVYAMAKTIRKKPLGALTPGFQISKELARTLDAVLPLDAHQLANGRLHISLTNVATQKNEVLFQFRSRLELIEALVASCHIPVYSGTKFPTVNGQQYCDGGLTNNMLCFSDGRTVTVSPFSGKQDIGPRDSLKKGKGYYVTLHNQDIQMNLNNFRRMSHAFFPPPTQVLQQYYEQGHNDTSRFLVKEGLYQILKPSDTPLVYESSV